MKQYALKNILTNFEIYNNNNNLYFVHNTVSTPSLFIDKGTVQK